MVTGNCFYKKNIVHSLICVGHNLNDIIAHTVTIGLLLYELTFNRRVEEKQQQKDESQAEGCRREGKSAELLHVHLNV